jgi:hypothetical protein
MSYDLFDDDLIYLSIFSKTLTRLSIDPHRVFKSLIVQELIDRKSNKRGEY